MRNSPVAGRNLARRTVLLQCVVVALVAALCSLRGFDEMLAVMVGGFSIIAAGWASAAVSFSGGVLSAYSALLRIVIGVLVKWIVVIAALYLGAKLLGLSPVYILAGLLVGLLAQLLAALNR